MKSNPKINIIIQVRRYRIRIKKFINAYRGKIIKIYERYGFLSRDSLGLGEPYTISLVLRPRDTPDWSPEDESLKIDTISQNRSNFIKKIMKFDFNSKKRF